MITIIVIMICICVCSLIQNVQLFYAAFDGKLNDVQRLIEQGAIVQRSNPYCVSNILLSCITPLLYCILYTVKHEKFAETLFPRCRKSAKF